MRIFSRNVYQWLAVVVGLVFLAGCASKIPHMLVADYNKRNTRLIAIMPVIDKSSDEKAADMIRAKVLEALSQKGYPKIPFQVIDEKIPKNGLTGLKTAKDLLGVDAVLWITLEECTRSVTLLYARIHVAAHFVIKDAKTGEVLWEVRHRASERNVDITRKRVELKSVQAYEPTMQEVVKRAMETLPDGPDL